MSDQTPQPPAQPPASPTTGHADVDAALARVQDLHEQPLSEHHDRLAAVHETLHQVLAQRPDQG